VAAAWLAAGGTKVGVLEMQQGAANEGHRGTHPGPIRLTQAIRFIENQRVDEVGVGRPRTRRRPLRSAGRHSPWLTVTSGKHARLYDVKLSRSIPSSVSYLAFAA
jgi:hypothetical protein